MDIRVKATDYQITPEVSEYLDQRVAQIEKTLGAESEQARFEVEIGRAEGHHKHSEYHYFAELQLMRPGTARLVASNHEPTVNAAIDNAKDELLRQLRQDKRLHSRLWRKSTGAAQQ